MKWQSPLLFDQFTRIHCPETRRQLVGSFTKLPRWFHETALTMPDEIHPLNSIKLFVSLSVLLNAFKENMSGVVTTLHY